MGCSLIGVNDFEIPKVRLPRRCPNRGGRKFDSMTGHCTLKSQLFDSLAGARTGEGVSSIPWSGLESDSDNTISIHAGDQGQQGLNACRRNVFALAGFEQIFHPSSELEFALCIVIAVGNDRQQTGSAPIGFVLHRATWLKSSPPRDPAPVRPSRHGLFLRRGPSPLPRSCFRAWPCPGLAPSASKLVDAAPRGP